jgi:hypothetical protein
MDDAMQAAGGCAVVIPEISIALLVSADPAVPISAWHLTLKPKPSSSISSDIFRMNLYFGGAADNNSKSASKKNQKLGKYKIVPNANSESSVSLLYQEGSSDVVMIDFDRNATDCLQLAESLPGDIASVSPWSHGQWCITTQGGSAFVLSYDNSGKHESVSTIRVLQSRYSGPANNTATAVNIEPAQLLGMPFSRAEEDNTDGARIGRIVMGASELNFACSFDKQDLPPNEARDEIASSLNISAYSRQLSSGTSDTDKRRGDDENSYRRGLTVLTSCVADSTVVSVVAKSSRSYFFIEFIHVLLVV